MNAFKTTRIAMWSGPRNISTAMMRSWENRPDCSVVDEPFYAYYLHKSKSPHPMFEQVLASQAKDYATVAKHLSMGACESPLQYQKHMTQHILSMDDLSWAQDLHHCFLIRDPAYVVASYTHSRGECSAEDIGIIRQYKLYELFKKQSNRVIPVIDAQMVLSQPEKTLGNLCEALKIPFFSQMLSWPAGSRDSDGIWAKHWYHRVEKSTGFAPTKSKQIKLSPQQQAVVDEVMPYYTKLKQCVLSD